MKIKTATSNTEVRFLKIAISLASTSESRMKHGAIVVKSGNVLGMGINKTRNSPKIMKSAPLGCSVHAEVAAVRSAGYNVSGATVYVARVNRNGEHRNSAPCSECQKVLNKLGVKRVVHTQDH